MLSLLFQLLLELLELWRYASVSLQKGHEKHRLFLMMREINYILNS